MRAREILLELDVVNTNFVRSWCNIFAHQVDTFAAKQWFQRALFRYLINQPDLNRPFTGEDVAVYLARLKNPALKAKIENWQENDLWVFSPPDDMVNELANVLHWVQANEQDERFLRQLPRITPPVAVQKAQQWISSSATSTVRTQGVEVVHKHPDGYHWVRYTDPETMRIDGEHLQNCLRHGTYTGMITAEDQDVYALRDGQNHPHVAIAVDGERIVEAKGKQNDPIADKYVGYTIDFLNSIGGLQSADEYLRRAGIHQRDGRFGTIEQIADHTRRDGWDFYVMPLRGQMSILSVRQAGKELLTASLNEDAITTINHVELRFEQTIDALNASGFRPAYKVVSIHPRGNQSGIREPIVYRDGRYGDYEELGDRFVRNGIHFYAVDDIRFFRIGRRHFAATIQDGEVVDVHPVVKGATEAVIEALNALEYPPRPDMFGLNTIEVQWGIVYSPSKGLYGRIDQVADRHRQIEHAEVYEIGERFLIFVDDVKSLTAIVADGEIVRMRLHSARRMNQLVRVLNKISIPLADDAQSNLSPYAGYQNGRYIVTH